MKGEAENRLLRAWSWLKIIDSLIMDKDKRPTDGGRKYSQLDTSLSWQAVSGKIVEDEITPELQGNDPCVEPCLLIREEMLSIMGVWTTKSLQQWAWVSCYYITLPYQQFTFGSFSSEACNSFCRSSGNCSSGVLGLPPRIGYTYGWTLHKA